MISVIIPTHKRADLLFFELERIYNQKNVELEVVVINDVEDEDETDDIVNLFPDVLYIKSKDIQGPSNKRKKGFSLTKGEFIYTPDDDDYLTDDHFFEKAIRIFNKENNLSFVSGNVKIRVENENHEVIEKKSNCLNISGRINGLVYLQEFQNKFQKPISTVSSIFKRDCLDGDMIEMSDSSIYMQALFYGDAYIMNDVVADYRVRKVSGLSLTTSASLPFIMNVLNQKEQFYFRAKGKIERPLDFWCYQYALTYSLFNQKPKQRIDKIRLLFWGLCHIHGSLKMFLFIIKSFVKIFILRRSK